MSIRETEKLTEKVNKLLEKLEQFRKEASADSYKHEIIGEILDAINGQTVEIERWQKKLENFQIGFDVAVAEKNSYMMRCSEAMRQLKMAKSEAVKAFVEELEDKLVEVVYDTGDYEHYAYDKNETHIVIDELLKKFEAEGPAKRFPSLNAGDDVYVREFAGKGDFKAFKVTSVNYRQSESETEIWYNAKMLNSSWDCNCTFEEKNIGDTVFLTYKEANNVLEREKNNG